MEEVENFEEFINNSPNVIKNRDALFSDVIPWFFREVSFYFYVFAYYRIYYNDIGYY